MQNVIFKSVLNIQSITRIFMYHIPWFPHLAQHEGQFSWQHWKWDLTFKRRQLFFILPQNTTSQLSHHVFFSCDCNTLKHQQRNGHILRIRTFSRSLQRALVYEPANKNTWWLEIRNSQWIPLSHWAHLKCECTFAFLIAYLTEIVNVVLLMWCIMSFRSKSQITELTLILSGRCVNEHVTL